jgi:hypothetical protein
VTGLGLLESERRSAIDRSLFGRADQLPVQVVELALLNKNPQISYDRLIY